MAPPYALQELPRSSPTTSWAGVKVYEAIVKGETSRPGIPGKLQGAHQGDGRASASTSRSSRPRARRSKCGSWTKTCSARAEELGSTSAGPNVGSDEEDARRAAEESGF